MTSMQDYPQETIDLVSCLFYDKQLSRTSISKETGLTIHQLREIYKILSVQSKGRGKRPITAEFEKV